MADSLQTSEPSQTKQEYDSITIELIQKIEWKRFEELCRAYLEAKGGRAEATRVGPDGGIDIKLYNAKSVKPYAIVQCKAYNSRPVKVSEVRELFGVMAGEKIIHGIFMTTNIFSQRAIDFAKGKKLILINGVELVSSIFEMPKTHKASCWILQ